MHLHLVNKFEQLCQQALKLPLPAAGAVRFCGTILSLLSQEILLEATLAHDVAPICACYTCDAATDSSAISSSLSS